MASFSAPPSSHGYRGDDVISQWRMEERMRIMFIIKADTHRHSVDVSYCFYCCHYYSLAQGAQLQVVRWSWTTFHLIPELVFSVFTLGQWRCGAASPLRLNPDYGGCPSERHGYRPCGQAEASPVWWSIPSCAMWEEALCAVADTLVSDLYDNHHFSFPCLL